MTRWDPRDAGEPISLYAPREGVWLNARDTMRVYSRRPDRWQMFVDRLMRRNTTWVEGSETVVKIGGVEHRLPKPRETVYWAHPTEGTLIKIVASGFKPWGEC